MKKPVVNLRPILVPDAIALAKEANDIHVFRGLRDYFPHPYSVDDALRFIEIVQSKSGPITDWAIDVDGEVAGIMGVFVGEDVFRLNAELGYWIGRRFWGRGIMTDAIKQTVKYCWEKLEVQRIYAEVFGSNPASQRVLEKCGFTKEYELEDIVIKEGKITSAICFGLRRAVASQSV